MRTKEEILAKRKEIEENLQTHKQLRDLLSKDPAINTVNLTVERYLSYKEAPSVTQLRLLNWVLGVDELPF